MEGLTSCFEVKVSSLASRGRGASASVRCSSVMVGVNLSSGEFGGVVVRCDGLPTSGGRILYSFFRGFVVWGERKFVSLLFLLCGLF